MKKINYIVHDFYPNLSFSKAGIFKLNEKWGGKGTHIMLFLLKPKDKTDSVFGTELYFNGEDFAQISFGEFQQKNLDGLFRTMKDISSKHNILEFTEPETIPSQENKITMAFSKINV